jgi:hypothetical protein
MDLDQITTEPQAIEGIYKQCHRFCHSFEDFMRHLLETQFWRNLDFPHNPYKRVLLELCQKIDELNSQLDNEPEYHNRSHFIDVCISLSLLLKSEAKFTEDFSHTVHWILSGQQKWLLLLCAVGHDFGHLGRVNQVPFEIESSSFELVKKFLVELPEDHKMALLNSQKMDDFLEQVKAIILATDPQYLPTLTKKILQSQDSFIDRLDLMSMLLVEADLMASIMPNYGKELGQRLSKEWQISNPSKADLILTNEGRKGFLNYVQFLSQHAKVLGIPQILNESIAAVSQQSL